ncbi:glycosyltransferase 87 family protein [Streptomyces sp. 8L]|uniref:glycosyltransferase 87 family protein n=1 Tax=Streptomyces sp. 8L TaxID=2877242 RepID=UPI001CD65843|nr:glycosyltransferase 87 family protein [Streptomyces sp. 8L]MCA1220856.1 glycosyltransferase 87 family protein [Streptomyces sp. 8L]
MAGAYGQTVRGTGGAIALWVLTRAVLLLLVFKVAWFPHLPGPDVTSDVSGIYHGWFDVLRTGTYPMSDVTWQYPPAAAFAILAPGLLPFLGYASAFYVLACVFDAVGFGLLLRAGSRSGRSLRGAWVWVAGIALLGPTAYARYDVMVTAVAVAALLAGVAGRSSGGRRRAGGGRGRPRLMGALTGLGALLKVWPVLLLLGTPRGRWTRLSWGSAVLAGAAVVLVCALYGPGGFAFLTFQRDRGTEVESLGSLVFHIARHFGWQGQVLLNYGSVEFVGPYVQAVSDAAMGLSALGFCWLLWWRLKARVFTAATLCDAAFVAVLVFTTTSRVISPQYMLWLVGLAAVCMVVRESVMGLPAAFVLLATAVTLLEFPGGFGHVVGSDTQGITLIVLRNGLLVAATLTGGRLLWKSTVSAPPPHTAGASAGGDAPAGEGSVSPDAASDTSATAG